MSTRQRSSYLELHRLSGLAHMRFTTRHRIEGAYSGRHQSRQHGGAGEFVDYREYSGGEDLRRLDWKVFARTGKAFVRLHQEETNLLCTLAVDISRSMSYGDQDGTVNKLDYVKYLMTALSHVISHGQDQVGLAVLSNKLVDRLPPGGTVSHVLAVQESIEQLATTRATTMAAGLQALFEQSNRRGVLLLASDFLMDDLEQVFATLRLFRHRAWEVVVLHVVHPGEERLPEGPSFRFEGMEEQLRISCSPTEIREEYERNFASHLEGVRQRSLMAGCDYRFVSTAIGYIDILRSFLVDRG